MPLTCPKCSRINPDDAFHCHADGFALRAYTTPATSNRLPQAFVFSSGRNCNTFDELVAAAQDCWAEARDYLKQGFFASYFGGINRKDLVQAAQEAAKNTDPDRGLDQMLASLPADKAVGARLTVTPADIDLGTLKPGQAKEFEVRIKNGGRGLLHGSLSCQDVYWLELGNVGGGQKQKLFQTLDETVVKIHIRDKVLRAANKPLEGVLTVQSSGGTTTINIKANVPVTPFAGGPLAGAMTPRQLAEKSKAHAKEAIPYYENGSVAAWYRANGWVYPIQGPTAAGIGAVQQFFEALGLTPPPKVEISERAVALQGPAGAQLQHNLQVTTPEKRPVYAHAVSDQPWLAVGKVKMTGRAVDIPLVVHIPEQAGNLSATLTVTANGNQTFSVPVRVTVAGGKAPHALPPTLIQNLPHVPTLSQPMSPVATVAPVIPVARTAPGPIKELPYSIPPAPPQAMTAQPPAAIPVTSVLASNDEPSEGKEKGIRWLPYVPVAFLVLALMGTLLRDLNADAPPQEVVKGDRLPDPPAKDPVELLEVAFHDTAVDVTLGRGGAKSDLTGENRINAVWQPSMRFCPHLLNEEKRRTKRLSFDRRGLTNNVVLKVDSKEWIFGDRLFKLEDGKLAGNADAVRGRWREENLRLDPDPKTKRERKGRRSIWVYDDVKLVVTQHIEVIVGQSGDLDTCLVQYRIDNEDDRDHTVGIRFLLDTFIGDNDGVPFLIPGEKELINTTKEINRAEDVPDFIQAREKENLKEPGTVAQIGLKLDGLESPNRVTLGAYPSVDLASKTFGKTQQEKTLWDVPVLPIHTLSKSDSCLVIYWDEKPLKKGESRTVGFTYGLGYLAGGEGKGNLALTAGGSFTPEGEITLTAYIQNPVKGQTATLTVPTGCELVEGKATEKVPPVGDASRTSPVSWKIRLPRKTGEMTLKVETSDGLTQSHTITIRPKRIFGN